MAQQAREDVTLQIERDRVNRAAELDKKVTKAGGAARERQQRLQGVSSIASGVTQGAVMLAGR
jgi:hypothetical protein